MTRIAPRALAVALIAAVALAACKRDAETPVATDTAPVATTPAPAPLPSATAPAAMSTSVSDLQLGNAVGPDNRVGTPATSFGTRDTLYASVTTAANTTGALGARWSYLGADGTAAPVAVDTQTKNVSGAAATTHEFHITKPDGWPVGRYRVEVTLDGNVVQTRDFDVR